MLFNTVINIDTSTSMIHNVSTRALCLLLLLLSFMMNNTLSSSANRNASNTLGSIANSNASNSIITPSTTTIIEISMINATIATIMINTGIHRCRTAVTTVTVVVTIITITMIVINTIVIIITSTRLSVLLLAAFYKS